MVGSNCAEYPKFPCLLDQTFVEAPISLALQSSLDAYAGTSALPSLETISLKKELDDKFLCWICHQDLPGDYFGLVLHSFDFQIV